MNISNHNFKKIKKISSKFDGVIVNWLEDTNRSSKFFIVK
ncbi:hypothetical protein BG20_I2195 [Candidatus Nitrosarchaeum limnium BG20]|uniref:Uncharacterized protein n=1 Tax=Candidatus Nitrosarchaeum limnium BG20 TaxID=859192 RepID=S2E068_9ARCH|nr:hypothetical protein BG20_I2195 [Candidatus Nitrosarchaeum limnium BG20]